MKIAAFYENIRTGAVQDGIPMAEAVAALCRSGLQGLYVGWQSAQQYPQELASVLRETGTEAVGLHGWIDFDRGGAEARAMIDRAAELGTDHALIVPVCEGGDVGRLIADMREAVRYGREKGVRVCMEDLDQASSPYNSLAGLKRFLEEIPDLCCCFDTGNWIMHGEDEVEAFKALRGRITALHLKDRVTAPVNGDDGARQILDGSVRYPVPVGQGYIRVAEILAMAGDWPAVVELYEYSPAHMLEGIRASVEWVKGQLRG